MTDSDESRWSDWEATSIVDNVLNLGGAAELGACESGSTGLDVLEIRCSGFRSFVIFHIHPFSHFILFTNIFKIILIF